MSIDKLDLKIIGILNKDAGRPYRTIAKELEVSDATVRNRVNKMIKDGIIKQFNVLLDYHKLGRIIKTFVCLRIQPTKLKEITDHLSVNPDIHVLYRTSGDMDVLAEVIFEKMEDLNQFLENEKT